MSLDRFQSVVSSAEELAGVIGVPSELALKKELKELDAHMRTFISESPFVLLGTVGRDGRCDVSPRGDVKPVASVVDARTLLLPERTGNRRADSLKNIIETGQVGLLFLIPGMIETLRVNGRARVIRDAGALESLAVQGKPPLVAIAIEIEECFLQCGKAVIRSHLWQEMTGECSSALPSFGKILIDQTQLADQTAESLDRTIAESYSQRLY